MVCLRSFASVSLTIIIHDLKNAMLRQLLRFTFHCFLLFLASGQLIAQTTTVSYTYSDADFVNPERGFYRYSETRSGSYNPLNLAEISGYRNLHTPFSADYSIYSSLVFRYFFLEDFKSEPISEGYLEAMETDFATAREAGVKLIPRFAYTDQVDNSCGNSFCPPYGDASKVIVLQHIEQLKPILQDNYDVILSVQMGLIGIWGENYYTDFFGDASQVPFTLSSTNWADRVEVLDSLLAALPSSRNVQVRYPQMKQKAVYGTSAPISSPAMIETEAFTGTNKSRIGFHNDCFLASADDFGTYNDYDNAVSDTSILKPYKAADSKFVFSGGETCFESAFSTCDDQGGNALEDMARLHYSYLNADYNNSVNNAWINDCLDSVKTSLGYRLTLETATFDDVVQSGGEFSCSISLSNVGWSSPINQRDLILVFINSTSAEQWTHQIDEDPRYWFSGDHSFSTSVCIPECMVAGDYDVFLKLSDPAPRLAHDPKYNIRLANQNVWNSTLGLNDLGHTVEVTSGVGSCSVAQRLTRINRWVGPDIGNWNEDASNWSLNKIPDFCDDVVIPFGKNVTISDGVVGNAHSVSIEDGGVLTTKPTGLLEVMD